MLGQRDRDARKLGRLSGRRHDLAFDAARSGEEIDDDAGRRTKTGDGGALLVVLLDDRDEHEASVASARVMRSTSASDSTAIASSTSPVNRIDMRAAHRMAREGRLSNESCPTASGAP
jgi:hypothetical protein